MITSAIAIHARTGGTIAPDGSGIATFARDESCRRFPRFRARVIGGMSLRSGSWSAMAAHPKIGESRLSRHRRAP
jgi:hypothetical protein